MKAFGALYVDELPELFEADMVVFLGEFNYRLDDISYNEARDFISQRSFDWLKEKDQRHIEMKYEVKCSTMREAVITFPPTYKFGRQQPGLAEKKADVENRVRMERHSTSRQQSFNSPVGS